MPGGPWKEKEGRRTTPVRRTVKSVASTPPIVSEMALMQSIILGIVIVLCGAFVVYMIAKDAWLL